MGILLDTVYGSLLVATSPLWLYKMLRHGRYRDDIAHRFGCVPKTHGRQPVIWIHGVSLGEVNAMRTLVTELNSQLPDYRVVMSTSTDTGMQQAKKLFSKDYKVFQWPLDFTLAVRKALRRIKPELVVLIEGDIWPNFLHECNRSKVPAVVVNGRMSPNKGYPGYKKLGPLAAMLFNRLTAIGVQTDEYGELFRSLGTKPEKIHTTGMVKFDTVEIADHLEGQERLAAALGISDDDQLIVAGGTGPGEEEILLDAYRQLKTEHPAAKLAIVPRKPERFEDVAKLIRSTGLPLVRRSEYPDDSPAANPNGGVILGDTMGELRKFYSLSACSFVGRSLVPMGGSDMIEAAALAVPTIFGPHTFNFPQADALAGSGCARVANAAELTQKLRNWLGDPLSARQAGQAAQQYVISQQGATRRNVEMICRVLNREPATREGAISTEAIKDDK